MEEEDAQLLENLNDKIVHFKMFNFSDHDSSLTSTWTKLRKIALATTLLVCFVPFVYSNYVADGHYHGLEKRTTLHKHATEILFAMCCLMFVDSVLDFLFTPINLLGTVDAVANLKVALLCSLFFPTLILLVLENQIYANFTVGLFIGVLAAQSFALCSTLFLFLNFHDEQIWTWQRTNFLVTLQIVTTFFRIAEYLYDMSWMYIVILALVIFQVLLIAFFGTQWILKHFVVLFEVFGWSKISVAARISSDEYMIICYICANFVLALSVIFVINTPAVLYVQTAVATVMILCPGRVARRNAVQLDFALESKKVFVQYISHEARAPLQVANMGLELHMRELQAAVAPDAPESVSFQSEDEAHQWFFLRYQHINEIVDACTTAQGTLNDMLTYDKIESGMLQMEKQVIPIFQFVASELKSFSIQARYKNIDLMWDRKDSVHPSLEHLTILGDRHKISQAFRNILSNALKFTPRDGKVSVKVRVMRLAPIATKKSRDSGILRAVVNSIPIPNFSRRIYSGSTDDFNETDISHLALDANMAERDEMYCRIEVHDTGTQLVQSHLSNLFTKSGDFDPTDLSQGGSNFLSLWLTKNIIELHGGRVGASSGGVELFGSIFYVDLPLNFDETDLDLERNGMVANGTGTGVGFCSGGGEACCSNAVGDGSKDSIGLNGNYAGSDASGETGGRPSAQLRTITRDDLWKQHEELERLKNTVLVQAMLTTTKAAADQAASKNTKNKIVPISTPTTTFAVGATMSDKTDLVLPDTGTASAGEEIPLPACESVDNEAAIGDSSVVSVDLAPLININSDCLHVLIVDDMAMNRKILCKALGQLDCHVICTEAVDGTEAVEIMANSIPSHPYFSAMNTNGHSPRQNNSSGIYYDIILIDSHMVTLNGPEAALKIRQDCKYSGFIYGVTGDMSGADEFKAMGADDVFPKPLRFDTLKDIIYDYRSKLLNQLQLISAHNNNTIKSAPSSSINNSVVITNGGGINTSWAGSRERVSSTGSVPGGP